MWKTIRIAACCMAAVLALESAACRAAHAQSPVVTAGGVQQETGAASADDTAAEMETAQEETSLSCGLRIFGPVLGVGDDSITIDNRSANSAAGAMILLLDGALILDGTDGYPAAASDLTVGEVVYAYIGDSMTMSLPPITSARMILCQIPQDAKAPDYAVVKEVSLNEAGEGTLLTGDGIIFTVSEETRILPYLTRQIVTASDLTAGCRLLIWSDETGLAQKIVLFAR